jgi:ATP-dependent Clp protease ATP-binding subunit ClpA
MELVLRRNARSYGDPRELLQSLHEHLQTQPLFSDRKLRVSPVTKLVFKLAFHLAGRAGRQTIERSDLFLAILEEGSGATASFMRRYGLEPEVLASQIASRMQENELSEEQLRKRYELPVHLKQLAIPSGSQLQSSQGVPRFGRHNIRAAYAWRRPASRSAPRAPPPAHQPARRMPDGPDAAPPSSVPTSRTHTGRCRSWSLT